MEITKIKAAYALAFHVHLEGGIRYKRKFTENTLNDDGSRLRKWETEAITLKEEERKKATNLRSKLYTLAGKNCVTTPLGFVFKNEDYNVVEEVLKQIDELVKDWNEQAQTCILAVYSAIFALADQDPRVIKAISDQIIAVTDKITRAIETEDRLILEKATAKLLQNKTPAEVMLLPANEKDSIIAKVKAYLIREATTDLKGVEKLFEGEQALAINEMVKDSRRAARKIIKLVDKKGLDLTEAMNEVNLVGIKRTRGMFIQTLENLQTINS